MDDYLESVCLLSNLNDLEWPLEVTSAAANHLMVKIQKYAASRTISERSVVSYVCLIPPDVILYLKNFKLIFDTIHNSQTNVNI